MLDAEGRYHGCHMKGLLIVYLLLVAVVVVQADSVSQDGVWRESSGTALPDIPRKARVYRLDREMFILALRDAPLEFTAEALRRDVTITLPMPDGTYARFRAEESPVMEPALAEKYPQIHTYRAQGIDDLTATARFGLTSAWCSCLRDFGRRRIFHRKPP